MALSDEDRIAELADEDAEQVEILDDMMGNLFLDVAKRGPYPDTFDVKAALSGDRTKYLVAVRNEIFDKEMEVVKKCPHGHRIEQVLDLSCLETFPMAKEAAAAFTEKRPLEFTLESGRKIQWQMLNGFLESAMLHAVQDNPKQAVTEGMAVRIIEIEGFDEMGIDKATQQDLRGWLRQYSSRELRKFRQHIADTECGVTTVVTVPCKEKRCQGEVKFDVLVEDAFFPLLVERGASTASSDS